MLHYWRIFEKYTIMNDQHWRFLFRAILHRILAVGSTNEK